MKIALMMENSQAAKNPVILKELKTVADEKGFPVYNVGMSDENDHHLTYIHLGIMASILLNAKAVDFVVTGCGTGQGALMSLNIHPGVICGYCIDPADAFLFAQINNGNALALPFAKGFGWGGELNLEYVFEKLFGFGHGQGYPKERVVPEQRNKKILDAVRAHNFKDLIACLKGIDQELVRGAIAGEHFAELFFANAKDEQIIAYVRELLG